VGAILLSRQGDLRSAYLWLLAPAVLSLVVLGISRLLFPAPRSLEIDLPTAARSSGESTALPRAF
jgi:hypothetical protein